ncbi:FAD:protein FMN transferase [Candidatus Woesearchaeota archaeon]|nr:FAD:protein FMN transferase [Candidatus Woesearchaeota archaeon]
MSRTTLIAPIHATGVSEAAPVVLDTTMKEIAYTNKLFGKEIEIVLFDTEEELIHDILEEAYSEALRLQKIFNLYDNKSCLSLLNKNRKIAVPKEFLEVLKVALDMCRRTNGLYDISLGKQFLQRKRNEDLTPLNCSFRDIKINGDIVTLSNADIIVDLGSIAKGYITDKIAEFIQSKGVVSGLIDARGDISVFGKQKRIIYVQHPRENDKFISALKLKNVGVATSGDYNQFDKDYDKCHIINQRDYISVTVVAPTVMEADAYATAIFVMPKNDVKKLVRDNKHIKVLCITKNLNIEIYNNLKEDIYKDEI